MAAGKADHVWKLDEVVAGRVDHAFPAVYVLTMRIIDRAHHTHRHHHGLSGLGEKRVQP